MFWLILGMVLVALVVALYMFALGVRAWWRGRQQYATSGRMLGLLALNLCEPLIGIVLVILFALTDIPWSTSEVHRRTVERAREIGLPVTEVPGWYDVDDAESLALLEAELAGEPLPFTSTARGTAAPATRSYLTRRAALARSAP